MHFPKFWARGEEQGQIAWGWSDQSESEARQRATERARKVALAFKNQQLGARRSYYAEGPMREALLEEFGSGDAAAV